jgi:type IX secretion system substrate protein
MKKIYILIVAIAVFVSLQSIAQQPYVNQVIVGSGGDFNNPDDHVSLASFKPGNGNTTSFGSIITASIQDIAISGKHAYIAAQDSIAKFDIDTHEKVAIVAASGINRLLVVEDELMASFQFPVTENFVKVYSCDDLSLVTTIGNISDESAGMLVVDNYAYVAVPAGWTSTIGKIAIISLNDYSLVDEIDFGSEGTGISDLFYYNNSIMSVNKTPWGGTTGYISTMSKMGANTQSHLVKAIIGKITGVDNDLLYTIMEGGIGSIDLSNFTIADTSVVDATILSIAATKLDTVNNLFYVTTTDYFSIGEGTIFNMDGEITGTLEAEIAPDAIAIDYRIISDHEEISGNTISVYPNPATDVLVIKSDDVEYNKIIINDISGRIVYSEQNNYQDNNKTLDIKNLKKGIYFISLSGNKNIFSYTFIKK